MGSNSTIDRIFSESLLYKSVIGLIISLPIIEIFTEIACKFEERIIPMFFVPMVLFGFGVISTIFILFYWVKAIKERRSLRYSDIFYFTLLFFMIISAVFSQNPGTFADGNVLYNENPPIFLAYFALFLAGTLIDNEKYQIRIMLSFVFVAILEGVFAFLQTFDIEFTYAVSYHASRAAYGLTQNSNFYGGMCVLFLACVSGLFIFADYFFNSKLIEYALLFAAAFLYYTMLGSRARLAWVGFGALVVFYMILLIIMYRKDRSALKPAVKRSLILLGAFFVVTCIVFFFTDYIREAAVRTYWEVANQNVDKMGSDRIYNWRKGLENVPKHWLTGVGLDNYRYVFVSDPGFKEGMYVQDKGHNEYIHILVTQGIPALINYLALLIYAGVGAVKNILKETSKKKRAICWILLGMFVTYCFQALFNSSIPYVVIHFWLVIGLIAPRNVISRNKNQLKT